MKQLYISCWLVLSLGSLIVDGAPAFRINQAPRAEFLSIRANLYFGAEDEEKIPVETDFYLLDESLVRILKSAKFKPVFPDRRKHRLTDEDYLEAAARALTSELNPQEKEDEEGTAVIVFLIDEAIAAHQISRARTGSSGQGSCLSVKPGRYYLFGIGKTETEAVLWHLPVEIKAGGTFIEIDQNNAAVIFPLEE